MKKLLGEILGDKVREVCIDMKEGLRKAVETVFPSAGVVVDPFHVIADSNKRMDEARRIEQDVHRRKKVQIPKKIFLVGREKLSEEKRQKVDTLLEKYPGLKGFYWAKEKIRELYRQPSRGEATKLLDNIIFNLKSADDADLIRWGKPQGHLSPTDLHVSQAIRDAFQHLNFGIIPFGKAIDPLSLTAAQGLLKDPLYYQFSNFLVRHTENLL